VRVPLARCRVRDCCLCCTRPTNHRRHGQRQGQGRWPRRQGGDGGRQVQQQCKLRRVVAVHNARQLSIARVALDACGVPCQRVLPWALLGPPGLQGGLASWLSPAMRHPRGQGPGAASGCVDGRGRGECLAPHAPACFICLLGRAHAPAVAFYGAPDAKLCLHCHVPWEAVECTQCPLPCARGAADTGPSVCAVLCVLSVIYRCLCLPRLRHQVWFEAQQPSRTLFSCK